MPRVQVTSTREQVTNWLIDHFISPMAHVVTSIKTDYVPAPLKSFMERFGQVFSNTAYRFFGPFIGNDVPAAAVPSVPVGEGSVAGIFEPNETSHAPQAPIVIPPPAVTQLPVIAQALSSRLMVSGVQRIPFVPFCQIARPVVVPPPITCCRP